MVREVVTLSYVMKSRKRSESELVFSSVATMRPSASRLLNLLVPVKRYVSVLIYSQSQRDACRVRSVDYAVKIRVNATQTGVDLNVKHSMVCF